MKNIRLIAKLDIKDEYLVKGIQLEGLRKLGDPNECARTYYHDGIDEIIYLDTVASLYNRNNLTDILIETTKRVFIPITVGGGIRTLDDVRKTLESGADKIAINTAAIKEPKIISRVADKYGSQCMVLSIQAKRQREGSWEAYYDNGREHTGKDVVEWAKRGYELGAGEILLTSVDRDGTKRGYDVELIKCVSEAVPIPVIACGGMGRIDDIVEAVCDGHADAVAMASVLHYGHLTIPDIKRSLAAKGLGMRGVRK